MRQKLYIFDWNGTLQDDLGHIYECGVERIFRHFSLDCPDMDTYRNQVTADFMGSFYWPNSVPKNVTASDLNIIMAEGFKEKGTPPNLFPDAIRTLDFLFTGNSLALVSAYDSTKLMPAVVRHGLDSVFANVRGDAYEKASVFQELMDLIGIRPENTICIGDMVEDAQAAAEVGAQPYAYPHGFHSRERLEAAKKEIPNLVIIESLFDLIKIK